MLPIKTYGIQWHQYLEGYFTALSSYIKKKWWQFNKLSGQVKKLEKNFRINPKQIEGRQ